MKRFILGLSLGLVMVACATREYTVYVLKYREGKLNGKTPSDDLPISVCDDDAQSKAKCYVLLRAEYMKVRSDIIEYKRRLDACEKSKK